MTVKSCEKLEKSRVALTIEVGAEEFEAAVNKAYLKMRGKMNIPGFRPGKAPRKMIESMYGAEVFYEEAVNAVLPDAYESAVDEQKLEVVGYPQVEIESVGKEGAVFKCTVAVYPEVELGQYKGLEAVKAEVKVMAADVNARLKEMADRNSRLVAVERAVKKGDTANIDFEGFDNGVAFEGGKGDAFDLEIGSGSFVPGFEDQLIGMKAGEEKDIDITFPENYTPELAGKPVVFHVKVNEVKVKEVPAIDDEFAKDVSEFDTLKELKADLKKKITEDRKVAAQQAFEDEQEILRTGKTVVKEEKEGHKDGSITYSLTSKAPLRDAVTREIIGTYGLSKDITDIRQAQQEVKKANEALEQKNNLLKQTIEELGRTQNKLVFAEKMAALGSLIGGIAHEINTPLGAIKASSTNISEVVEKINIDLPWLLNHASQDEIHWLFKFLTEADTRDLSVFSREERKIKRELACLFEENNIPNAPIAADTLVSLKLGYTPDQYLRFLQQPNAERLLQILKVLFSLKRNANNIFISVEKAAKVVRALKSYIYKNAAGAFESTDLPETIHTVLILTANLIKHSKTEIITNFESVPVILCRQDEICQVWTNIITNAIQAMGENGQLEIGIHLKDNSHIEITFKDNGPGIPEDVQPHIFEPYFTTKAKGLGTGMGLDISKQIIESHNGHIRFESTPEEGTTFIVVIPIHQS